jgi:hypothetical protein
MKMETATKERMPEARIVTWQHVRRDPVPFMMAGAGLAFGLCCNILSLVGLDFDLTGTMLICSEILMVGAIIWLDIIWRLNALSPQE